MSSDTENTSDAESGLPFTRPVVREIVEELFREQTQWRTGDIVTRVAQLHRERGGINNSAPEYTVKRVLQDLKSDGLVSIPGHGWWRHTNSSSEGDSDSKEPLTASVSDEEVIDDSEPTIRPEKEIGAGPESVYLYFNPNDRRLAELEGRDIWECKIGRTSGNDPIHRILNQGTRTALSRIPMIGLIIRTEDSTSLERALHISLRLIEAEVPDSPGVEWFVTSPTRIEAWYMSFQNALVALGSSFTNQGST